MIILFFFELSFLFRFVFDSIIAPQITKNYENWSYFQTEFTYDIVVFTEGLSFIFLLFFHFKNFRVQGKIDANSTASLLH